jgi:dihydrolipoyl dehydrogenase
MDVIIIGGGPAGRTAAIESSNLGENVILIEKDNIGGKCLNEGCMVVCGLNDISKFLNDAKNFKKIGILKKDYEISFECVTRGIKKTISKIREILEKETDDAGVTVLKGNAKIEDNLVLSGDEKYVYDKLIIATGSRPYIPPIPGSENAITYQDVLNIKNIPDDVVIVGGGIIAAEFAGIFSSLGSNVNLLCDYDFLEMLDNDIKNYVIKNLLEKVNVKENILIKRIDEDKVYTDKGNYNGKTFLATGMIPNSEIAKKIVDIGKKNEIIVNKRMTTSNKNIFAAGDVIGGIGNTPVARMEGIIAARNVSGIITEVNYKFVPYAISLYYDIGFISSETAEEGKEGYIPGSAGPGSFWNVLNANTGLTKLTVDIEKGNVNKVFSISPSARTTMAYISKLLKDGYKTHDFDNFIETHPSTDTTQKMLKFFSKYG